jgi:hypothetical protein
LTNNFGWTCFICGKPLLSNEGTHLNSPKWGNVQRHFCNEHHKYSLIGDEIPDSKNVCETLENLVDQNYNNWCQVTLFHFYVLFNSKYSCVRSNWWCE